jgi:CBS-domain-containing membrane protein
MNQSALTTFRFPENTCIPQAQSRLRGSVTLASPGLDVMPDLTEVKAAAIDPGTSLSGAEQMMIHQGVRLLFVVSEFPCIEGHVTSTDLLGDKRMRLVQAASAQSPARVRGVLSLTQLERQLGGPIAATEIEKALA